MTNSIEASVIVPTYDDWAMLGKCLAALSAQTADRATFEVIIANNNPTDAVPSDFDMAANARVVWQGKPGSYAARNAAVTAARGRVLFFTDSDCQPSATWVANGLKAIDAQPELDRIAGQIELFPAEARWAVAELYDKMFWLRQESYVAEKWGTTANLILRRVLFDRVGPFNEATFSGGDREWNQRAEAVGSRIHLDPEVVILHPARPDYAALAKKRARTVGGRQRLKAKSGFRRFVPPLGFLIPSIRSTRKILREPGLTLSQRLGLIVTDYRLQLVAFRAVVAIRYFGRAPNRS